MIYKADSANDFERVVPNADYHASGTLEYISIS